MASALDTLASALHSARLLDLPDILVPTVDYAAERQYLDKLAPEQRAIYREEKLRAMRNEKEAQEFFRARNIPYEARPRRPLAEGCTVTLFAQTWPSTGLGYDAQPRIVGHAFTHAYTVIVRCDTTGHAAVYFGTNPLAYLVSPETQESETWKDTISTQRMPGQHTAHELGWHNLDAAA